jgi:hypothetical protein
MLGLEAWKLIVVGSTNEAAAVKHLQQLSLCRWQVSSTTQRW